MEHVSNLKFNYLNHNVCLYIFVLPLLHVQVNCYQVQFAKKQYIFSIQIPLLQHYCMQHKKRVKTTIFSIFLSVLPDPCKPSLPFLAKSEATSGHFKATKFFYPCPHSQPHFWLHFLPLLQLFHTDPAIAGIFAVEVVPCPASFPLLKGTQA